MSTLSPQPLFGCPVRRIHCVGVGGMGMAPLAIYLAQSGYSVSGEDDALRPEVRAYLESAGVTIGAVPDECDLVTYSSAIAPAHPALVRVQGRDLLVTRRGELLAAVLRHRKLVAVCGSHGKTTTTAMLIEVLRRANFPAGYVLGGLFAAENRPPASRGENEWVVAEIDESDGTIGHFAPEITVVVNLDWDHADHYRQPGDMKETFAALCRRTRGPVLISKDCDLSRQLGVAEAKGGEVSRPYFSFGATGDFAGEITKENQAGITLKLGGKFSLEQAQVHARGAFNAANATAALATAQLMRANLRDDLLAEFPGVRRRQTILREAEDVTVLEDYAHHPTEVRALLSSLRRRMSGNGRLVTVFQPHRFSRTAQFKADFAKALALADRVHLLEVYGAGEAPLAGGTTADLLAECRHHAPALQVDHHTEEGRSLEAALTSELKPGDWIVFVGAGNIDRVARVWLKSLPTANTGAARWDEFVQALTGRLSADTKLRREEPLASKTTMGVGGAARLYAEPANIKDLQALLREARERGVPVHFLGRGSNLIITDEGVEGLVISLANPRWAVFEPRDNGRVWVGAGLRLKNLCGLAVKAGLMGFEFLEGIPGNIGGALRMNAGAMGGWIFDVVEEVQLMTKDGEIKVLPKSAMRVEYRMCADLLDAVALGALLRPAAAADSASVSRQIDVYKRKRQESQPREKSAGCIFKNPANGSAGRLIDEAGLKGERVGDAEVSPVHANFIVNRGHATGADVLVLIRRVRARIKAVNGIDLEPEAQLFGKNWKDVL